MSTDDYYIVVPASPWGGKQATFGPMGEEEAQERLAVYLPLYMPECPPKLLRVVRDYASNPAPAVTAAVAELREKG